MLFMYFVEKNSDYFQRDYLNECFLTHSNCSLLQLDMFNSTEIIKLLKLFSSSSRSNFVRHLGILIVFEVFKYIDKNICIFLLHINNQDS